MQQLNFQQIWRYREQLWQGLQVTLELTAIAVLAGLAIGLAARCCRDTAPSAKWAARLCGSVPHTLADPAVRGLFILPGLLEAAALRGGGHGAQSVLRRLCDRNPARRAGLDSAQPDRGGPCLGLSSWQVYRHIVLAPALRNVYPALGSQLVILLLGTSLASQVSAETCSTPAASSKAAPTQLRGLRGDLRPLFRAGADRQGHPDAAASRVSPGRSGARRKDENVSPGRTSPRCSPPCNGPWRWWCIALAVGAPLGLGWRSCAATPGAAALAGGGCNSWSRACRCWAC